MSFLLRDSTKKKKKTTTTEPLAAAALEQAQAKLRWVDDTFSTWKPQSPVSRLRRGEIGLDEAPPEVSEVLEFCRLVRAASDG